GIIEGAFVKQTEQKLQVIEVYLRKHDEINEGISQDDEDYVSRGYLESKYVDGINQQVLLANGSAMPLSEFISGSVDDSDFVKKTGQVTQLITGKLIRTNNTESFSNLETRLYATKYDIDGEFVRKTGKGLQKIQGYLRKDGDYAQDVSENDDDYMIRGVMQRNFVDINGTQSIIIIKRFYENITTDGFKIPRGKNQQILLANRSTKPLSEFASGSVDDSNFTKKTVKAIYSIE
ncbi:MAG: hypothetical protein EZS28_041262, partial [Streblomastix strix]